jgi:methylmalonyl-CoA/ethylmalonyl-CoA epimerase
MPQASPTRIAQVAIAIHDLERAKSFYAEVLGLTHLFDAPPGLAFFQCGETRLMLSRPEGPETAGNSILYYGVDDVAASVEAMRGRRVRGGPALHRPGGRQGHLAGRLPRQRRQPTRPDQRLTRGARFAIACYQSKS